MCFADFFQRQDLVDEGAYLATLGERAHLLQSCSLTCKEHAIESLVLLIEWCEVALRAEDGRQAPEGLRGRDALNNRPAAHGVKDDIHPLPAGIVESDLRHVLALVVYRHVSAKFFQDVLVVGTRRGEDTGTGCFGDLDGE